MHFKKALFGAAAVLATGVGAQAADLPAAAPAQYVKVCDTYGSGYFYIPGTTTCLQISGLVSIRGNYGEPAARKDTSFSMTARGRVTFDARSQTEYGLLRGVVRLQSTFANASGNTAIADLAFLQLGGLTVGYLGSLYDAPYYPTWWSFGSDRRVITAGYTASLGSGFSVTLAAEQRAYRNTSAADFAGESMPNLVANALVEQAWGSIKLSGALQQDRPAGAGIDAGYGFAGQLAAKINLPQLSKGSYVSVIGAYADGATSYVGITDAYRPSVTTPAGAAALTVSDFVVADGKIQKTGAWSLGGAFNYAVTPSVNMYATAMYTSIDGYGKTMDHNLTTIDVGATWSPVKDLVIGLDVIYATYDTTVALKDKDKWGGVIRVERSF